MNRVYARAARGRVSESDRVVLTDTGLPVAYINQALLVRPLTGADDDVLDEVDAFADAGTGAPMTLLSIWPTPDLAARGWHLMGHPAFVARPPLAALAPRPQAAPGASVRAAVTPADLVAAERVVIDGYPIPDATGIEPGSMLSPALEGEGVHVWLGSADGRAVAAAAARVGSGVVNLCLAATLPEARRRGVWSALVETRAAMAPELPAVAFTSDDSRPGFESLGFLVLTRFTLWYRGH